MSKRREHSVQCQSFDGALARFHRGYAAESVTPCDCWCHYREPQGSEEARS